MANFDDNPFADPFAESDIKKKPPQQEFDPFSDNTSSTGGPGIVSAPPQYVQPPNAASEPAVVTPSAPLPAYSQSGQQQMTTEEFQRRQEELERKAQELARKEEELRNAGNLGARQNNWPPLPSFLPVGPCFYQDINVDIPLEFQKIIRFLYYIWISYVLMLMLNVIGALAYWLTGLDWGANFGVSVVYLLVFTPFSYVCWFRPIYKAFRSDSSFNFMVFFFIFFFQIVVSILAAIGALGVCGWASVAKSFGASHPALGVFLFILALMSTSLAGAMVVSIIWVHRIYRSTGASFSKAQAEFTQGVMRNEHVQAAAANAAASAVRSQFGAAQSPGTASTTSTGPRF